MYLDANNLYGWGMSQKLPVNSFNSQNMSKFNETFIKNSDKGYVLEVHVEYNKVSQSSQWFTIFTRKNEN